MTDIRDIRRTLGLTQAQLGAKLGLHQGTISRFESGDLPVDERTRLALEALAARPAETDPGAPPPFPNPPLGTVHTAPRPTTNPIPKGITPNGSSASPKSSKISGRLSNSSAGESEAVAQQEAA